MERMGQIKTLHFHLRKTQMRHDIFFLKREKNEKMHVFFLPPPPPPTIFPT